MDLFQLNIMEILDRVNALSKEKERLESDRIKKSI